MFRPIDHVDDPDVLADVLAMIETIKSDRTYGPYAVYRDGWLYIQHEDGSVTKEPLL